MNTLRNLTTKQNCLLGSMIGDAIGAGFEFKQPNKILKSEILNPKTIRDHTFSQFKGRYTDDFSQTLAVEDSLQNKKDFNQCMVEWYYGHYWVNGQIFDCGMQTATGLSYFIRYGNVKDMPNNSGNGSMMRLAPLAFHDSTVETAIYYCEITHNSEESMFWSYQYVRFLQQLLHLMNRYEDKVVMRWQAILAYNQIFSDAIKKANIRINDREQVRGGGYIIDTVFSVGESIARSNNFESAIVNAISMGGDTDTVASITGAIAGIMYGVESINDDWLEYIQPSLQSPHVSNLIFGKKS